MPQNKKATKKTTAASKKTRSKKKEAPTPPPKMNIAQSAALSGLTPRFQHSGAHRMTQQSLIEKGYAVTDASGTRLKSTALGRKRDKQLKKNPPKAPVPRTPRTPVAASVPTSAPAAAPAPTPVDYPPRTSGNELP